jgi:hypothetical protein
MPEAFWRMNCLIQHHYAMDNALYRDKTQKAGILITIFNGQC